MAHPIIFAVTGSLAIVCWVLLSRSSMGRTARWSWRVGAALLALAAGGPHVPWPRGGDIFVLVDTSASTRSALYRDRTALNTRLGQLLAGRSFRLLAFADRSVSLAANGPIAEMASERTVFAPPADARAIVLLSDGRFDLPTKLPAPVFPVIDPGLIDPPDARVIDASAFGASAVVQIENRSQALRPASLDGLPLPTLQAGETQTRRFTVDEGRPMHRVEIAGGDLWPENDAIAFSSAIDPPRPRWWIGASPPAGWTQMSPDALPPDDAWLSPSCVAIANEPAGAFSPATSAVLDRYVRRFGGTIVLAGGDHAFALGHYGGSVLDALSPLASDPPQSTNRWLLVIDGSGSMAGALSGGDRTRWSAAIDVLHDTLHQLPANDKVRIGSFAQSLQWWDDVQTVGEAQSHPPVPPPSLPGGPTNLQAMLDELPASSMPAPSNDLLLLTDGDAPLDHAVEVAAALRAAHMRLNLLAIGSGSALPGLRQIAADTGGRAIAESDGARWIAAARTLMQDAQPNRVVRSITHVTGTPALADVPLPAPAEANRTWLKSSATLLAAADSSGGPVPLVASQAVGAGRVMGQAFADAAMTAQLAERLGQSPRDPHVVIAWPGDGAGLVSVSATGSDDCNANGLTVRLDLIDRGTATLSIPQTAPGQYAAALPTSSKPRLAIVRVGDREVDRRTLPGRYAPEFAELGIDADRLAAIARESGGRVIEPSEVLPIEFPREWVWLDCSAGLALAGAGAMVFALAAWKWRMR